MLEQPESQRTYVFCWKKQRNVTLSLFKKKITNRLKYLKNLLFPILNNLHTKLFRKSYLFYSQNMNYNFSSVVMRNFPKYKTKIYIFLGWIVRNYFGGGLLPAPKVIKPYILSKSLANTPKIPSTNRTRKIPNNFAQHLSIQ